MTWQTAIQAIGVVTITLTLKAQAAGEHFREHYREGLQWDEPLSLVGSAQAMAFVVFAGALFAVAIVAFNWSKHRRRHEGHTKVLKLEPDNPSANEKLRTVDCVESALSSISPSPPSTPSVLTGPPETMMPEPENAIVKRFDNDAVSNTDFKLTFLDCAADLLEDDVESKPLDKELYKALKQWQPPRIKPRLTDESRRRISAMSSVGMNKFKRNETGAITV